LVGAAALFLLLGLLAYGFRDPIATKVAGFVLDRRPGMRCTHPEIRVDRSLELAIVAPIDCSIADGPITRFVAQSDMEVELDGFSAKRVRIERAMMDQRERDVSNVESNTLGDLADLVGFRDSLVKGMLDAGEMYAGKGPVIQMDTVISKRAGKTEAVMHGFRITHENGWDRQFAARMESGPDIAAIRNFDLRVTPKRGQLSLDLFLGKPEPGEKPDIELQVEGRQLDEKKPHFKLSM
jgi:hypothetical protein